MNVWAGSAVLCASPVLVVELLAPHCRPSPLVALDVPAAPAAVLLGTLAYSVFGSSRPGYDPRGPHQES